MQMVLLTALGVGGATVLGALSGFATKKISHRFSDITLAFAAGVMLAAAVIGLILELGLARDLMQYREWKRLRRNEQIEEYRKVNANDRRKQSDSG